MFKDKISTFNLNSLMWFLQNICLPLSIPLVIYKLIDKIYIEKRKDSLHGKVILALIDTFSLIYTYNKIITDV